MIVKGNMVNFEKSLREILIPYKRKNKERERKLWNKIWDVAGNAFNIKEGTVYITCYGYNKQVAIVEGKKLIAIFKKHGCKLEVK